VCTLYYSPKSTDVSSGFSEGVECRCPTCVTMILGGLNEAVFRVGIHVQIHDSDGCLTRKIFATLVSERWHWRYRVKACSPAGGFEIILAVELMHTYCYLYAGASELRSTR
jgi:hypothetical protein